MLPPLLSLSVCSLLLLCLPCSVDVEQQLWLHLIGLPKAFLPPTLSASPLHSLRSRQHFEIDDVVAYYEVQYPV